MPKFLFGHLSLKQSIFFLLTVTHKIAGRKKNAIYSKKLTHKRTYQTL